jgi:hypothetical protein
LEGGNKLSKGYVCEKCKETYYYEDEMTFLDCDGSEIIMKEDNWIIPSKTICNYCYEERDK